MGLNETTRAMRESLAQISVDLEKAAGGNKAAAQRVRTGTIKLEKTAKNYRKESIAAEKSGTGPKRQSQKDKKSASKVAKSSKAKTVAKTVAKTASKPAAKPAAKTASKSNARQAVVSSKKPTAKLPLKKG